MSVAIIIFLVSISILVLIFLIYCLTSSNDFQKVDIKINPDPMFTYIETKVPEEEQKEEKHTGKRFEVEVQYTSGKATCLFKDGDDAVEHNSPVEAFQEMYDWYRFGETRYYTWEFDNGVHVFDREKIETLVFTEA